MLTINLGGSYKDLNQSLVQAEQAGFTSPFSATNSQNENVIVQRTHDYIRLDTFQDNGWIRVNEYYPDGTITETYER